MKEEILTSYYLSPIFLPFECIHSVQGSLLLAVCSKCLSFLVYWSIPLFLSNYRLVRGYSWLMLVTGKKFFGKWALIYIFTCRKKVGKTKWQRDPVGVLLSPVKKLPFSLFEFPPPASYWTLLGSPWCSLICVLYSFICAFSIGNNLNSQTA